MAYGDRYVDSVLAMLGEPQFQYADAGAWLRLERELGFELPSDFKTITDAYAPMKINGHLYLAHPATDRWNLGTSIRQAIKAWSEVPWDDVDLEGDPRIALGIPEMRFGTQDGLLPVVVTDRGEAIFMVPDVHGQGWRIFTDGGDGEFFEYSMSFAEWLYRYLIGEDMVGPGSSAFYPGPVKMQRLPMSPQDRPEPFYGPARGI